MATGNQPRKNSRGGRAAQLSVSLEAIKDKSTREALENVVGFVRDMIAGGLAMDGDIRGRSFETDTGGAWRVQVFESTIRTRNASLLDVTSLRVPGKILGAFGYSQINGSATWQLMPWSSSASHLGAYWYLGSDATDRMVQIRNNDTVHENRYRAIIFYSGDRA